MNKNTKSYNVSIITGKAFSFIIVGFQFATSLFFRIRDRLRITFMPSFIGKLVSTINLRRVRLIISQVKLITSITQTINLKRVKLVINFRQIMKFVTTIFLRQPILFISTARQKLITTMKTGILKIIADPTLAQFFSLGDYDPLTLGDLDPDTLGDLDYTT